ncbi:MAG TPA: alpha-amylase family glycosyl hydrolase [Ideonella sp.]|uniref:alpha-amylase family glycosyl hydrolase n=1 Tax=Ideonella sp. TaxID=1929293 RepID=UPI002E378359|nr:alpha-amylase family glycosyl hydrolase [Ideonella sp.]HEX5683795.1 alpha-amylase family glycosyl hydrolase [Ideonella sp.]
MNLTLRFRDASFAALLATVTTAQAQPVDLSPVPLQPPPSVLPEGWHHGAFMEIFVRAYQDSDGDGIGDLRGLISRLDYLKELGVKGLWLMPIQRNADGDHGYATSEFRSVAPEYGTLADFDELIKQAHARGIGVVMDYVINHSAAQHPLFVEALKGKGNPYRDWFVWSDVPPAGWDIWDKYPWYHAAARPWLFQGHPKDLPKPPPGATGFYFGTFGPHMPDFNLRNPQVLEYHLSSLRFWLNRGLDGYRLDAVPHMIENDAVRWNDQPESRRLTKQLQDLIKQYPHRYVVCEATAEPAAYGDPAVCGGAFSFGYTQHFVGAARGDALSVQKLAEFYRTASPTMATFVSNHDIFAGQRLWDQVGGDLARYRVAAAGYLLQPGTPFIYYGEEVGQAGVMQLEGDLPLRSPMSWSAAPGSVGFTTGTPFRPFAPNAEAFNAAAATKDPTSLHAFYKAMLGLRNSRPSIAKGSFEASFADGLVLGFQRRLGIERSLVVINYGTRAAMVRVPGLAASDRLQPLYPARADATTGDTLTLAPQSIQVFDLQAR